MKSLGNVVYNYSSAQYRVWCDVEGNKTGLIRREELLERVAAAGVHYKQKSNGDILW